MSKKKTTAAEAAKMHGWKSLAELAEHRRVSTMTLNRWYKNNRKLFNAAVNMERKYD